MTICCDSSPMSGSRGFSSPCSTPSPTDVPIIRRKVSCKRFRSTKGASKARRDHINAEIRNMRRLLPISPEDQERLSYLHSMSAICTYVRKSLFFQGLWSDNGPNSSLLYEGLLQALPGFILAMTREGKLIYVSENVSEYLGFSMVDLLQGDSFYSMVEGRDVNIVKSYLEDRSMESVEKAFVCRMHTSKPFRVRQGGTCTILVRGRFQSHTQSSGANPGLEQAFVGFCTPTVDWVMDSNLMKFTQHFQTVHQLDMTFVHACESTLFYLGFSSEDMNGRSWYDLLYPADLVLGVKAHKILLQVNDGTPVEMVLRLQCRDLSWKRLYIQATKDAGKQTVTCTNHIISETEAEFLMQKIYTNIQGPSRCPHLMKSDQRPTVHHACLYWGNGAIAGLSAQQRIPSNEQPQNKSSSVALGETFSLTSTLQACDNGHSLADHQEAVSPYSLHSSSSSYSPTLQAEEEDPQFFLDMSDYTEDLLSLQEGLSPVLPIQDPLCGSSGFLPTSKPLQPIMSHDFPLADIYQQSAWFPDPCCSPSESIQSIRGHNFPLADISEPSVWSPEPCSSPSDPIQPITDHRFPLADTDQLSPQPTEPCPSPTEYLQPIIAHGFSYNHTDGMCPWSPSTSSSSLPTSPADGQAVPDHLLTSTMYEGLTNCSLDPDVPIQSTSDQDTAGFYFAPLSGPATPATFDVSPYPSPSPLLDFDCPNSTLQYSQREQAEISILAQQISSLTNSFDVYRNPAGQTQSLRTGYMKESASYSGCESGSIPSALEASASWSHPVAHPAKLELVLDEDVIDSILKDLDRVSGVDPMSCSGPISNCSLEISVGYRNGQQTTDAASAGICSDVLPFADLVEGLSFQQPPGSKTAETS